MCVCSLNRQLVPSAADRTNKITRLQKIQCCLHASLVYSFGSSHCTMKTARHWAQVGRPQCRVWPPCLLSWFVARRYNQQHSVPVSQFKRSGQVEASLKMTLSKIVQIDCTRQTHWVYPVPGSFRLIVDCHSSLLVSRSQMGALLAVVTCVALAVVPVYVAGSWRSARLHLRTIAVDSTESNVGCLALPNSIVAFREEHCWPRNNKNVTTARTSSSIWPAVQFKWVTFTHHWMAITTSALKYTNKELIMNRTKHSYTRSIANLCA